MKPNSPIAKIPTVDAIQTDEMTTSWNKQQTRNISVDKCPTYRFKLLITQLSCQAAVLLAHASCCCSWSTYFTINFAGLSLCILSTWQHNLFPWCKAVVNGNLTFVSSQMSLFFSLSMCSLPQLSRFQRAEWYVICHLSAVLCRTYNFQNLYYILVVVLSGLNIYIYRPVQMAARSKA